MEKYDPQLKEVTQAAVFLVFWQHFDFLEYDDFGKSVTVVSFDPGGEKTRYPVGAMPKSVWVGLATIGRALVEVGQTEIPSKSGLHRISKEHLQHFWMLNKIWVADPTTQKNMYTYN